MLKYIIILIFFQNIASFPRCYVYPLTTCWISPRPSYNHMGWSKDIKLKQNMYFFYPRHDYKYLKNYGILLWEQDQGLRWQSPVMNPENQALETSIRVHIWVHLTVRTFIKSVLCQSKAVKPRSIIFHCTIIMHQWKPCLMRLLEWSGDGRERERWRGEHHHLLGLSWGCGRGQTELWPQFLLAE